MLTGTPVHKMSTNGENQMRFLIRTLLLAMAVLVSLQAQDITKGSIAGVVRDATGAVVPGATVKLTSPYGDRTATTTSEGAYSFQSLVVGSGYNLAVEHAGFATAKAANL